MNMASAASVGRHFGFRVPPLFEVILPMTETAEEMLAVQEAFEEIHSLKHPLYKLDGFLTNLRIIPLFEEVKTIIHSDKILIKYLSLYKDRFKKEPPYMRPYVARSDPALNSGIIPTVLAIKIALSHYKELSKKIGIPLYPIIGAASLPFRGSLTPENVKNFVNEYRGIRTTTIQSAFRYDFPLHKVKLAIAYLEKHFSRNVAVSITQNEEKKLLLIIEEAEKQYKKVIEYIAPVINVIASFVPQRRERFLHIGLFGYSRGEGKVTLPRAISFTCALYSLGIPPEFIATGQAIAYAKKENSLALLELHYINLKSDLITAGRFLNKKNLKKFSKISSAWGEVLESIEIIEEYVGQNLGPTTQQEKKHESLTEKILEELSHKESLTHYIKQAAVIRKSLG